MAGGRVGSGENNSKFNEFNDRFSSWLGENFSKLKLFIREAAVISSIYDRFLYPIYCCFSFCENVLFGNFVCIVCCCCLRISLRVLALIVQRLETICGRWRGRSLFFNSLQTTSMTDFLKCGFIFLLTLLFGPSSTQCGEEIGICNIRSCFWAYLRFYTSSLLLK